MGLEALLTTQIIGLQPLLDAKLEGSTGSTDNRVLRSDGTGGVTVQDSGVTIDDSGNVTVGGTYVAVTQIRRQNGYNSGLRLDSNNGDLLS